MKRTGTFPLTAISYDKNTVVCVSNRREDSKHGVLTVSHAGKQFETCFDVAEYNVVDVCYSTGHKLFVGMTDNGYILQSPDGQVWTIKPGRFFNANLISLTWDEQREQWEAVFLNDGVESYYYSDDSLNWKLERVESEDTGQ